MTHEELIQIVRETPPEDLPADVVELLRLRAAESVELRAELAAHLALEELLSGALGKPAFSADDVIRQGRRMARGRRLRAAAIYLAGMAAATAIGMGVWTRLDGWRSPAAPPAPPRAVVQDVASTIDPPSIVSGGSKSPEKIDETPKMPNADAPPEPAQPREIVRREPWDDALGQPPRPFLDACFEGVPLGSSALARWWQPVNGKIAPGQSRNVPGLVMDGMFRLRPEWPEGSVLRILVLDNKLWRTTFWNDHVGLTLQMDDATGQIWTYRVEREPGQSKPVPREYLGSDGHRYLRTGRGSISFRHENGRLLATRGDVLLFSMACPERPTEITLEAKGLLGATTMEPAAAFPEELLEVDRSPVNLPQPAPPNDAWRALDANARIERVADSLKLASAATNSAAFAFCDLPTDQNAAEVIFRIEEPEDGTGVYLGDASGKPRAAIVFTRDAKSGAMTYSFGRADGRSKPPRMEFDRDVLPIAGQGIWLKLMCGAGVAKCWTSPDGREWHKAIEPLRGTEGSCATAGVFVAPRREKRDPAAAIRLTQFAISPGPDISPLADEATLARVPEADDRVEYGAWLARTLAAQPRDVETPAWLVACALRTLEQSPRASLAKPLLIGLAAESASSTRPLADRLRLLDSLAMLADTADTQVTLSFAAQYERLALEWLRGPESEQPDLIRRRAMLAPLWSTAAAQYISPVAVRAEVVARVQRGEWDALARLGQRIDYFSGRGFYDERQPPDRLAMLRLLDWSDGLIARNVPEHVPKQLPPWSQKLSVGASQSWRHPQVERLSREGYNLLAELEAALAGQAFAEASRLAESIGPRHLVGLLPLQRHPELLVSLPVAIELEAAAYPAWREALQASAGPVAQLRYRAALEAGDAASLALLPWQYPATTGAAMAQEWLGDRALSMGAAARAAEHYRRAAPLAPSAALTFKQGMAAAMQGKPATVTKPIAKDRPIVLGNESFEPEQVESLLTSLLERSAAPHHPADDARSVPVPARYELSPVSVNKIELGRDPSLPGPRHIDGVACQWSATVAGETVIANNRFDVIALDRRSGSVLWRAPPLIDMGRTTSWPLTEMRPQALGTRVLARRLAGPGPVLECFDTAKGARQWGTAATEIVAGDPLVLDGRIFAPTVESGGTETAELSLTEFDPATGRVVSRQPLAAFQATGLGPPACLTAVAGDTMLVVTSGAVVACDADGQHKWLRRQLWLPPSVDPKAAPVRYSQPLFNDRLVFVAQPGVPGVSAMDFRTGQHVWQSPLPDVDRLVSLTERQLIVETAGGFAALEPATGGLLWEHMAPRRLNAVMADEKFVCFVVLERVDDRRSEPCLVWIEARTGREASRCPLPARRGERPALGPFLCGGAARWLLAGDDAGRVERQIMRLERDDESSGDAEEWVLPGAWQTSLPPAMARPWGMVPWTLLMSQGNPRAYAGVASAWSDAITTESQVNREVCWARQVYVPDRTDTRFVAHVAAVSGQPWTLEIQVGAEVVQNVTIDQSPEHDGQRVEIDLAAQRGRTTWLFARHRSEFGSPCVSLWKSLEVMTRGGDEP